mgnify:CR=1 FL=1
MLVGHKSYHSRIVELLQEDPGQSVKTLAGQLKVNRTFLAGYLEAMENLGYVKSKKVGPARVYFETRSKRV